MKNISIARIFLIINILIIGFSILSSSLAVWYANVQSELNQKHEIRYKSYQIALYFRQTKIEMTEMARAYVATGNEQFANRYWNLLDIKQGKEAGFEGRSVSMRQLMHEAGFTKSEFDKMKDAEDKLDYLVTIEERALYAMRGLYDDGLGNYIRKAAPDSAYALRLLYSPEYFLTNEAINEAVNDFFKQIDTRTLQSVESYTLKSNKIGIFMDFVMVITLFLIVISYIIIRKKVIKPVAHLQHFSERIAVGDLSANIETVYNDEIGKLATAFTTLSDGLKFKSDVLQEIGKGRLDMDLVPLSDKDIITKSLITMRDNLRTAKAEEAKRKIEDEQRNWTTEGLARFSELLRQDTDNISKLANNIVVNLVRYLNANVGSLFLINDNEPDDVHIELIVTFAYDRNRNLHKRIELEEGLIGRAIYESETIYMTDVPNSYIKITSGLGDENPRSILIVPLKTNDRVLGVVELASLQYFDNYQIKFVELLGESIASTLISSRINQRTALLLDETRQQAEVMAAQEEEMRQNIEELQATQEMLDQKDRQQKKEIARLMAENNTKLNELEKKELESKGIIDALNQTTFLIELDFDGTILFVNDYVLRKFSITHADIIGKNQADFMVSNAVLREECKQIWSAIRNGEVAAHISNIQINNQLFWFADTYTPVFDKDGKPYKVLKISHDITENRLRESELKLMADRLKTHEEELRQNLEEMQATQEALALKDEEQQHIIDRLIAENETKIQAIKTNIESELAASNEKHQLQCFTYESMIQDYKNSEVEWHKQMEALKIEIAELRNKID